MHRLLLVLLIALPALGKSLHWRSIDVQARLDADGKLHVVERQRIVFDGDWNGGERNFNLREHQTLDLHRIVRVENGREIALERGSVDVIDGYDFAEDDVVRWRSRMPTDPPFANREITYVLHYSYAQIVGVRGESFTLSHDFGLPERAGVVERFTLLLQFDPVWRTADVRVARENLQPGEGVAVARTMQFAGAGWPAAVRKPPARWPAPLVFLGFAGAAWLLLRAFLRGERAKGRFAALEPRFDPELLTIRAEVAGAVWDAGIGAAEVAATLARMAQEQKIATRVEDDTMHLRLKVPRKELQGYELELVKSLFVTGCDETDTLAIRSYYSKTGFDPVRIIAPPIEAELQARIPGWGTKARLDVGPLVLMMLGALIVVGLAALLAVSDAAGGSIFVGALFGGIAAIVARVQQRKIGTPAETLVAPVVLLALPSLSFAAACLQQHRDPISAWVLVPIALWLLAWIRLTLELLKIPDPEPLIAYRQRIAAARKFFMHELQQPQPALRDEWFPYLLAFGLGPQIDQWFRGFGATRSAASAGSWSGASSASSSSSSSGSGSSSPSWTGGGGAFGGAGATGSWAIAAGAMAAGVAAPGSSSSGGGGGGGGGSSSGGGGGGGW